MILGICDSGAVVCDPLLELTGHEGSQTLSRNNRYGESYKGVLVVCGVGGKWEGQGAEP